MKILVVTTPIRPVPSDYPPLGCLVLINYLRKNGFDDVEFYDIDSNRSPYEEDIAHIRAAAPDVIGISAVVSTAYEITERLSRDVKAALPDTLVVVGGNLAASAEILLRKARVDVCVAGEGEKIFLNVVRQWQRSRDVLELATVRGLIMLDGNGDLLNTGYETQIDKSEVYDIDWSDLEKSSDINLFISGLEDRSKSLNYDPRSKEKHRAEKKVGTLVASKGCVARCTFCHRWDTGIRYVPVDILMERLKEIIDRYDIGIVEFGDENFGTDRRWLKEFCTKIKQFDLLWRVGGMRVNCVTPEAIAMMRDAGCISIIYGMETGSPRMLEIMEKKTSIKANRDAMKWTVEAGLWTGVQLVVGMPGESPATIDETIDFSKYAMTLDPRQNPNDMSVNYAQALPGTPLYEFARHKGFIGQDIDSERDYLLRISDKEAHDEVSTLNFTDYPKLVCRTWRPKITVEVNYHYVKKFGLDHYRRILLNDCTLYNKSGRDKGYYANPKRLVDTSEMTDTIHDVHETFDLDATDAKLPGLFTLLRQGRLGLALVSYPVAAYRCRHLLPLLILIKALRMEGPKGVATLLAGYFAFLWRRLMGAKAFTHDYKSLRKIVNLDLGPLPGDAPAMAPLRKGR